MTERKPTLYILDMPWPVAILAALSACLFVTLCVGRIVYRPYRIPSGSMQPVLAPGDFVIADTFAYAGGRQPRRGDVVVCEPGTSGLDYIKRVVGIGGDAVQLRDGVLYVNGEAAALRPLGERTADEAGDRVTVRAYEEQVSGSRPYEVYDRGPTSGDNTGIYRVPKGMVFVLGDDRDNSNDSRAEVEGFSFVGQGAIVGRVAYRLPRPARPGAAL